MPNQTTYTSVNIEDYFDQPSKKEFAEKLLSIIERKGSGGVIAIDSNWGQGKTYFATKMVEFLNQKRYKASVIDTFESDYFDDPFTLLSASFASLFTNKTKAKKFKRSAVQVSKLYLPKVLGALGSIVARGLLNKAGVEKESIKDLLEVFKEGEQKLFEESLNIFNDSKDTIQKFKDELSEFATSQPHRPVVIFIDELDRCKPGFALAFIERIKHFFDVDGVLFILMINRTQLEHYIGEVYKVPSPQNQEYLYKFISLFLTLPKSKVLKDILYSDTFRFTNEYYRETNANIVDLNIPILLSALSVTMGLSLRDIEKILFELTFYSNNLGPSLLLTFILAIKLKKREILVGISMGQDRKTQYDNLRSYIYPLKHHPELKTTYEQVSGFLLAFHDPDLINQPSYQIPIELRTAILLSSEMDAPHVLTRLILNVIL